MAEREWNVHHAIWQRAWYRGHVEKSYREHRGLKARMYIPEHQALHANIYPPMKPTRELLLGATAMLDALPDDVLGQPLETITRLGEWYLDIDERLPQRIGENLLSQIPYIEKGIIC